MLKKKKKRCFGSRAEVKLEQLCCKQVTCIHYMGLYQYRGSYRYRGSYTILWVKTQLFPGPYLDHLHIRLLVQVFFINLVPSSEETSFLTTFYGLYFSHHYTHITHYKSCWTFCVGSYSCTALWTLPLLIYGYVYMLSQPKLLLWKKYLWGK